MLNYLKTFIQFCRINLHWVEEWVCGVEYGMKYLGLKIVALDMGMLMKRRTLRPVGLKLSFKKPRNIYY